MEEFPQIETVYQAIETLYHNPDCERKNEANRWLIDLQKSVYAWKIADELLQRGADIDSCYFGAQMIRNKIIFAYHELPQDAVLSLHNSLMQHLKNMTKITDNIIITQLCISLVDLSLQMSTWNNPITTFLSKCNDISPSVLLEILRVFPEEIDTKVIRLGANRRNEIENELSNCAGLLNNYVKEVIVQDSRQEILLKAILCFSSWVNIIRNVDDIVQCDLIPQVFQILTDPPDSMYETSSTIESKLHDAAADLLCNILRTFRGSDADQVLDINLYLKISAFENAYHTSVARESPEKSINYCRIFTELGEAFLNKMVYQTKPDNAHFSLKIMELILNCVGHHDYEVCSITFNFWFSLSEMLYRQDDDELSCIFKPYINRLIIALCRQVQMEPDSEGILDDDGDDFKMFRDKVCDLVRDSIFIVGSSSTFCEILMKMHSDLSWDQMEAYLFIMYSIAWKISPENNVIPRTVESILNFPNSHHVAVRYTGILILGELRDWFNEHSDYLIPALQYLQYNLQNKELADAAATSLCLICSSAKMKLKDEFPPLIDILKNLPILSLSNKSAINIIKGVVLVMCQLSPEEILIALKTICSHQAESLVKILKNGEMNTDNSESNDNNNPIVWLDRIAATFKFVKETNQTDNSNFPENLQAACVNAFAEINPVLLQVMDAYRNVLTVMERCCRCMRFAIRCVGKAGIFIVQPLIQKLVHLYRENRHCCFLYLGSIIVDEYGNDSTNWEVLLQMLDAFIGPSFAIFQTENGLRDNPDTVDDLFRLCCRVLQRLPVAFLRTVTVGSLLECATAAISIDHREANSSVMKFLHELFDCTNSDDELSEPVKRECIKQIYEKNGEVIMRNLIHASVLVLPSYTIVNVAEVILDLIRFNSQVTYKWIESAVQQLPNQTAAGSMMASPEQILTFLNCCGQATKTRDISKALRDFALYFY